MKSVGWSRPELVFEDLGEKVVHGLAVSVRRAARDLREYRRIRPDWVAGHGPRGLANWIQDRIWVHLCAEFDQLEDVLLIESGATRELMVHSRYRFRIKRHHADLAVSTFPTQTALEFMEQPTGQLPGLEETRLIVGYAWDRDTNTMESRGLVTLRDGLENVIWQRHLPEVDIDEAGGGGSVEPRPQTDGPIAPVIELPIRDANDDVADGWDE